MHRFDSTMALAAGLTAAICLVPCVFAQERGEAAGSGAIHASRLPASDYYLARNSLVEIELLEALDTASARRNQEFHYRVTRDIKGDGGVVIARGTEGRGTVLESRKGSKAITGRLHLDFGEVPSVEGRPVKLGFTLHAMKANESPGGLNLVIGGYFESSGPRARLDAGQKLRVTVEYPYGTRRVQATEDGAKYHLFQADPARE